MSACCARVRSARGHGRSGNGRGCSRGDGGSGWLGRMGQGARAQWADWGFGQGPRSAAEWVDRPLNAHPPSSRLGTRGTLGMFCRRRRGGRVAQVAASRCQRPRRRLRPRLPGYLRRGRVVGCWRGAVGGARRAGRGGRGATGGARYAAQMYTNSIDSTNRRFLFDKKIQMNSFDKLNDR